MKFFSIFPLLFCLQQPAQTGWAVPELDLGPDQDIEDFILAEDFRIDEALASIQHEKRIQDGVGHAEFALEVQGSIRPELIKIGDSLMFFTSVFKENPNRIVQELRNRGYHEADLEILNELLDFETQKMGEAVLYQMSGTPLGYLLESRERRLEASDEDFEDFITQARELFETAVRDRAIDFFSRISRTSQRVMVHYLNEKFTAMNRNYYFKVNPKEVVLYRQQGWR